MALFKSTSRITSTPRTSSSSSKSAQTPSPSVAAKRKAEDGAGSHKKPRVENEEAVDILQSLGKAADGRKVLVDRFDDIQRCMANRKLSVIHVFYSNEEIADGTVASFIFPALITDRIIIDIAEKELSILYNPGANDTRVGELIEELYGEDIGPDRPKKFIKRFRAEFNDPRFCITTNFIDTGVVDWIDGENEVDTHISVFDPKRHFDIKGKVHIIFLGNPDDCPELVVWKDDSAIAKEVLDDFASRRRKITDAEGKNSRKGKNDQEEDEGEEDEAEEDEAEDDEDDEEDDDEAEEDEEEDGETEEDEGEEDEGEEDEGEDDEGEEDEGEDDESVIEVKDDESVIEGQGEDDDVIEISKPASSAFKKANKTTG